MKKRDALVPVRPLLLVLAATAAACRGASDAPQGERGGTAAPSVSAPGHGDEHEALARKVRPGPAVERDAAIRTLPARREVLVPTVSLPGEIAADPDKTGQVSSPVAGRVENVVVQPGSSVKRGDVVATLRVPDLGRMRGALSATRARAKSARANEVRLRALYEKGLTAEREYVDVRADAEAFEAEASALSEQLAAVGAGGGRGYLLRLRAPVSGIVVSRDAVVGQPVNAEHVVAHVADLSQVWFLARVFEKDLGSLRLGAPAEIGLSAYPTRRFDGTVDYVGHQIDPVARTLTARIRVANPGGLLRLGLFGTARVAAADAETDGSPVLVVQRTAVVDVAGKTVVFVRHDDGEFELHEVVLGPSAPGKVSVVAGLRDGEAVVVEGAFTLKSLVLKGSMEDHD